MMVVRKRKGVKLYLVNMVVKSWKSIKIKKNLDINEKLEEYKNLEYGRTFSNLKKAKLVIDFYVVTNKKDIRVKKSDTIRVSYCCVLGYPFRC